MHSQSLSRFLYLFLFLWASSATAPPGLEPGMMVQLANGAKARVTKVMDETVTIDANAALAVRVWHRTPSYVCDTGLLHMRHASFLWVAKVTDETVTVDANAALAVFVWHRTSLYVCDTGLFQMWHVSIMWVTKVTDKTVTMDANAALAVRNDFSMWHASFKSRSR